MNLPTSAGKTSDLTEKVVDVIVLSCLVLPYMSMYKYPITVSQADTGTSSDTSTHLPSKTIKCTVSL